MSINYLWVIQYDIPFKTTVKQLNITSIDVLPSKNQALCEYCTLVSKLKHC